MSRLAKRTLMQEYGIAGGTIDKAMDLLRGTGPNNRQWGIATLSFGHVPPW
jgi:hypothetical protein